MFSFAVTTIFDASFVCQESFPWSFFLAVSGPVPESTDQAALVCNGME
jgi:hypothetical protein